MSDDEGRELMIRTLKIIKNECEKRVTCAGCRLLDKAYKDWGCVLRGIPAAWDIEAIEKDN